MKDMPFDYIVENSKKMKSIVSGSESTLILRHLMDRYLFGPTTTYEEKVLSNVVYRDQETSFMFSYLRPIIRDYVNYNIRKNYGMSLEDYLELTPYMKLHCDEFAEECNKLMQEEIQNLNKKENNIKETKVTGGLNGI